MPKCNCIISSVLQKTFLLIFPLYGHRFCKYGELECIYFDRSYKESSSTGFNHFDYFLRLPTVNRILMTLPRVDTYLFILAYTPVSRLPVACRYRSFHQVIFFGLLRDIFWCASGQPWRYPSMGKSIPEQPNFGCFLPAGTGPFLPGDFFWFASDFFWFSAVLSEHE